MSEWSLPSVAAGFVAGLALLVPSAASAQTRQFQNWIVGCDNAHVCTAIAFAEPLKSVMEPGIPFLQIRHHPDRDATPEIRILDPGASAEGDRLAKGSARLVATPTGAEVAKGPASYVADFEGNGGFRFRSARAWSLLGHLRSRDAIRISIGSKQNLRLDTSGLEAALAYMDDQQELAGTPGALVRKPDGTLQDYLHPTPPDVATVEGAAFGEAAESEIAIAALPPVRGCKALQPSGYARGYALRGSSSLLSVACSDDAHNSLSAWYMLPGLNRRAGPHAWPGGGDSRRQDPALLANAQVLPNGGTVRAVRYRAASRDCGVSERWAWTKGGRFELIERREMPACRTAGPSHWIVTYRADFVSPE